MLATQTPDTPAEAADVRQIKEKLAQSLKALQKRYVTSDAVVTSEDADANLLCCALEAIFIHGIKAKFIRLEAAGRSRKSDRGLLPQPFFWNLLKTVTHRDVVTELEKLGYVSTDVGRCRAWLRLALNHGLLECYMVSLFREDSKLRTHYQPGALLLHSEEREVLLSYLQGLSSLTFNLSYKSSVLNMWTTTPLALAGLCPPAQVDPVDPPVNGLKDQWDSESQSSSSSDAPVLTGRACGVSTGDQAVLHSSNLSLDTTASSQLSSSLSSDSFLQGNDPRAPTVESSSDLGVISNGTGSTKRPQKESLSDLQESSQDSLMEDSIVFSETALSSGSDRDTQSPVLASQHPEKEEPPSITAPSDPELMDVPSAESRDDQLPVVDVDPHVQGPRDEREQETHTAPAEEKKEMEKDDSDTSADRGLCRSVSILSRKMSSDSLPTSRSWIAEDDIYKPHLDEVSDNDDSSCSAPVVADVKVNQAPPSVVHRRQIGLSNPFRGLLKLGHLERRSAMARWRSCYCELSPSQFNVYLNAEERTSVDSCLLLRCDDVRLTSPEGRFELVFPGKRLSLRAANRDEAEDWVDRIQEAMRECRPASRTDDQWEVLQPTENGVDERAPVSSALSSPPEQCSSSSDRGTLADKATPLLLQQLDWTRAAQLERDAIKEAVLYLSTDADTQTWTRLVFSLSMEALKGFKVQDGKKMVRFIHPIEEIRDVVPDVSQGGPSFFKLLTVRDTLRLRAENANEARSWRVLVRGALDSYLESGEEETASSPAVGHSELTGNLHRLVQHRLKEDGALLGHLWVVPAEKGLDAQNFKCAGCPQQIGPSLSRARLCEFSGLHYCYSCHDGDTSIIPSRVLHNWDLTQREVSKKALWLLSEVEDEPLLNLEQLNPDLLKHSEAVAHTHGLRHKLRLLGDYLLTCRSGACRKLQERMGSRTYLLESSRLYSVLDLRQMAGGLYDNFLLTLLHHAANHVFHCDLCTQRGFICQICHSNDIIFPFQFDITTRCKECKAVFHLSCKETARSCPRCERMKKYLQRKLLD